MLDKFKFFLEKIFNINLHSGFLLTLAFSLVSGCDSSSQRADGAEPFSYTNSEYTQLIDDILALQQAIGSGHVLRSNPERTKTYINAAIIQARSGLFLLAKSGERTLEEKKKAHTAFVNSIRQYESFHILEVDQERFDKVFNQVRFLKHELGTELGIDQTEETWTVFNHNFSTSGLEPTFTTLGFEKSGKPSDESKWFTNFQTDLPKARAQGRDGSYGWMISRPFDLTAVANPKFRYFGSYLVVAPNNVLPLSEVIRQVFKTYILLDYEPGDNPEDYSDDRKILVKYNLDDLPLGRDFDDAWTPFADLSPYKQNNVAVGFLFDTRGINFTQYYSWTVFDFEINGAGKIPDDPVKYKQDFQGSDLGLFKSYSLTFPGKNWSISDEMATMFFEADVENKSDNIDTFLLSPILTIPKAMVAPELKIEEAFLKDHFQSQNLEDYQILISKDYKGGQSPSENNWVVLDRVQNKLSESKRFIGIQHTFSLLDYQGESIVVAFRFKSKDRDTQKHVLNWGIESIQILGQAAEITVVDYFLPESTDFQVAFIDFKKKSVLDFETNYIDSSPRWQKKDNGFVISGFTGLGNPPDLGPARLTLPEINLVGKQDTRLRFEQKVFFFRDNNVSSEVVKVQIRIKGSPDWNTLEIPKGTFRDKMPREPELSDWIKLPELYDNQIIELSFAYQAKNGNGGTVEWTFSSLEVGAK